MANILQFFIWIPFLGFVLSLLFNKRNEKAISGVAIASTFSNLLLSIIFVVLWLINNHPILNIKHVVLFQTEDIEIFIDYFFDKTSLVFLIIGNFISFIVIIFSKYYLHREEGFKRFFNTTLLFIFSFNIVILAGNFETLFIGWEILGICSFLLISFYRDRYLPVKNSLKVISIYRLGDVCLILAMWMSHHLWHENITFIQLNDVKLVQAHLLEHNWYGFFIALMILIAASAKSAQLPFSTWLPRAMEGPTTSSAIFYGSLSVHLGVFILLRTYPYWESILLIKTLTIAIGLSTAIIATGIARVQSSVKTQIAYSSIAQIGLIFIEIALGFHLLALVHFTGNAFLRTYQLLVSPSVLSYLIHDMLFSFVPKRTKEYSRFISKCKNTFYLLSIKEWNLDRFHYNAFWNPIKWVGRHLNLLSNKTAIVILSIIFAIGLYSFYFQENIPRSIFELLPFIYSFGGLILIIKAFAERGDAMWAWFFVIGGQMFIALSIALLNENFGHNHILLYLSGSLVSVLIGYLSLKRIKAIDNNIQLNQFHGYIYEHPKTAFVFLLACLGFVGLPFTPTFIGIDILFSHIHKHEELLIISTSLSLALIEISILRIYARVFLGSHKKAYHATAYRSS
jgi:NADH-quinone oxidoreductase subunit L